MPKAYYSTVFDQTADDVWKAIRAFDHYAWAGVVSEVSMEDGKAGDAVGGVRRIVSGQHLMRQRLVAHSDAERSYTYDLCEPSPYPVRDYHATLRVTPITDSGRAFVEWWATFDCADHERQRWTDHFERNGFAVWLESLRSYLG
ncbi:SRPBCC family protein [Fodinicola acaciae]|uniref:SRPBCC family protein n=1 Tax=Fodinicola acaciae TaxID=2681555 RepID=UPI0013D1DCE5|nr:SRPBCC family protein [Fodinicola acaciae]